MSKVKIMLNQLKKKRKLAAKTITNLKFWN